MSSSRQPIPSLPVTRQRQAVSGASHLLRRAQLCRARHRDGARPLEGAAVLLPEEPRQRRHGRQVSRIRGMTSDVHLEIEMVVALGKGGVDIPVEEGARSCVRLRRRPRYDPSRSAGRGQEARTALGSRQGLRSLGPVHGRWSRRAEIGHPTSRRGDAEGQRRPQADRATSTR